MAMKKKPKDGEPAAGEGRISPEATGVAPDLRLLGPEEIREVFAKAAECDDLRSRLLRAQADFENFRRREAQERRRAAEDEADSVLAPVLDALDTFTRTVEAAEKARDFQALLDGVNLAFRDLERLLGEAGVRRIEGVGQALDPSMHAAILQEPTDEFPPLTVLQVFAHGWRRGDRVLRPAKVKVASPTAPPTAKADPGKGNG